MSNRKPQWNIEHNPTSKGVAGKVQQSLAKDRSPLDIVTLSDLYPLDPDKKDAIRAALYSHAFNTPVSQRNKTSIGYALKVEIAKTKKEIFCALPGMLRQWILINNDKDFVKSVKFRCEQLYGKAVVQYMLQSLQWRSVDQASAAMREVKKQSNHKCRMCEALGITAKPPRISACHIIDRRTVFWLAVDSLLHHNINILSEEGLSCLQQAVTNNLYHSSPKYIIPLCPQHDQDMRKAIRNVQPLPGEQLQPIECYFQFATEHQTS
ncbi:MAG: hypothetical protein EA401_01080 [Planctomycetota bacterium]|nr:MAG: hypothetical protein EA401_01080 [Planctomycetota bacterium]